ncbi:MAG: MutS family DNA mismatch repair protein [Rhodothermales bacterium]
MQTNEDQIRLLERTISRLEVQAARRAARSAALSRVRLGIALVGVAAVYATDGAWAWVAGLAATAVFLFVARIHGRVVRSLKAHRIYIQIKRTHLARMAINWEALPPAESVEIPATHPFAGDLNLVGNRSVHHLLNTATSRDGARELATWLTHHQNHAMRQQWVRELIPLTGFRDRISLVSALVSREPEDRFDGQLLVDWLERPDDPGRVNVVLAVLTTLAALNIGLVVTHSLGLTGPWWVFSLVAYVGVYLMNSRLYSHLFDEAEHLYYALLRFRPVLERVERFRFHDRPALSALCAPLQREEPRPSRVLRRIMWLTVAASAQKNEILRVVLNLIGPWDLFFSRVLARYKGELGGRVPTWLAVWRQLEAACSLANWAALHPEATFPEFSDIPGEGEERDAPTRVEASTRAGASPSANAPLLEAEALGHPLIPPADRVTNPVRLEGPGYVALITGSNMSGKSTYLRTVGVNVCMAFAGGVVHATHLRLAPVRLFTSITVSDSVNDGISFFYAEVKRLRALLDALSDRDAAPLLFLIDEIFRGTNNRERFTGSKSVIEALSTGNGAGLVTTHDLDLVELPGIENFHFREHVADGRMTFDYRLRPGPCPTTNALTIMRMEGLPVPD